MGTHSLGGLAAALGDKRKVGTRSSSVLRSGTLRFRVTAPGMRRGVNCSASTKSAMQLGLGLGAKTVFSRKPHTANLYQIFNIYTAHGSRKNHSLRPSPSPYPVRDIYVSPDPAAKLSHNPPALGRFSQSRARVLISTRFATLAVLYTAFIYHRAIRIHRSTTRGLCFSQRMPSADSLACIRGWCSMRGFVFWV